ncbi:MAG: GAF domain-containing sensor histidine kinase [Candidatus Microsaccharimonas sp.]
MIETLIVIGGIIIAAMVGVYIYTRDIHLVFVRGLSYIFTLIVLTCIYLLAAAALLFFFSYASPQQAVGTPFGFAALAPALLVAVLFPWVKRFMNRLTDKMLYRDNYSISYFVGGVSQILNSTNDLRTLLERISVFVASTVKTSQVFFLVHLPEGRYMTAGTSRHARVVPSEFLGYNDQFDEHTKIVTAAQLEKSHPLRRMMVSHRITALVPLYKRGEVTGFLCLGMPRRGVYTTRDVRALYSITDELVIAIQNAQSVDEVRKLNSTLEQRISAATGELRRSNAQLQRLDKAKDEFISMASHQLRTPLTSIKGYLSMLIEGDIGDVTKDQKKVLSEAFVSSERMVRLIGDFLNVSRLQTGKFVIEKRPVDLAKLVQREIDGLEQNALARNMRFVYKKPKDIPHVNIDENKVQQVVMNFCDNAIYYSKEKSKITVTLQKSGNSVVFKVIDTGIGVPKAEQVRLFHKFFRAENARRVRPDGTGVGLFLAKKVIDDHGGSIIFESKEGKGSTFGFRLPIE